MLDPTPSPASPSKGPSLKPVLRVLIVEDSEFDAQMMVSLLRKGGYDVIFERVESAQALTAALADRAWDVVLSDYNLPRFNAPGALNILRESGLDLPFLIVSGGIGEDVAVAGMKAGAHDYLMKGNLHRLVTAVEPELREASNRASQREGKKALQESELRYRLLWETAPDAVLLMDADGCIHFANPAVRQVFGYTPEEIIGQRLAKLQPERLRGTHQGAFDRYLRTGVKAVSWSAAESIVLRKNDEEIPIEI